MMLTWARLVVAMQAVITLTHHAAAQCNGTSLELDTPPPFTVGQVVGVEVGTYVGAGVCCDIVAVVTTPDGVEHEIIVDVGCVGVDTFTPGPLYTITAEDAAFGEVCWLSTQTSECEEFDTGMCWFVVDEPVCSPDLDADGIVGIVDLLLVFNHWGTANALGDANLDGQVDIDDVVVVLCNWGVPAAGGLFCY